MSTPEFRQRVKRIRDLAERLKGLPDNHELVTDFMRESAGPSDVVWVCDQLIKALARNVNDSAGLLKNVRELLAVETNDDIIPVLTDLIQRCDQPLDEVFDSNMEFSDYENDEDDEQGLCIVS